MARTRIALRKRKIRLAKIDLSERLPGKKKQYEKRQAQKQLEMLAIQQAYYQQNRRAIILFEGWDAAGKGGAIRRLTAKLDPRGYRVHSIGAPTREEQGTHYLYRFWQRLPPPGRIAIFDRTWYGRVLVERVEGFAQPAAWERAYDEINELEHLLMDDGVRVVKIFLHISQDEQRTRLVERLRNPAKHWKITEDDLRNRGRWDEYAAAIEAMFDRTSTKAAPWSVVAADHKWYARMQVLDLVIGALAKGVDLEPPERDEEFLATAAAQLGVEL